MASCSPQQPGRAGSHTAPRVPVIVAEPSPCTPAFGSFPLSWPRQEGCTARHPRELLRSGPLRTPPSTDRVSACDWDPDVGKSFPCYPSWLGSTNLTVKRKNAIPVQIHPCGENPMLGCLDAPKPSGI